MTDLTPAQIDAQIAQLKKEKIELQLTWLADLCDLNDAHDGKVPTSFIRQRIAAIKESL